MAERGSGSPHFMVMFRNRVEVLNPIIQQSYICRICKNALTSHFCTNMSALKDGWRQDETFPVALDCSVVESCEPIVIVLYKLHKNPTLALHLSVGWLNTYFPMSLSFIHTSPLADWTSESTPAVLRLSSIYLWSDGTQQHQRYPCLSLSAPQASFNHFVQLIIAVITFPDSFLVCKSKTSLSLLSLLEGASFYFVAEVPFMIFISIHSGAFSSRKHALISIIHTVESAEVNVSWKAVLVPLTYFSVF